MLIKVFSSFTKGTMRIISAFAALDFLVFRLNGNLISILNSFCSSHSGFSGLRGFYFGSVCGMSSEFLTY